MEQSLVNQENNAEQSPFFGNNRLFSGTTFGEPRVSMEKIIFCAVSKMDFTSLVLAARPNIKPNSAKAYATSLKLLAPEGAQDLDFLLDPVPILDRLDKYKHTTRRNYLNAIIVVLKGSGAPAAEPALAEYEKHRDAYNDEYAEQVQTHTKTPRQKEIWIEWPEYLDIVEKLRADAPGTRNVWTPERRQAYQDYLLTLLYSKYPLRNDFAGVRVIGKKAYNALSLEDKKDTNYLVKHKTNKYFFVLNEYKTSKKYGEKKIQLDEEVLKPLRAWLRHNDSGFLFVNKKMQPLTSNGITKDLNRIGVKYRGKPFGSSILRHSYLSHKYGKEQSEKEKDADMMGHSLATQGDYIKTDEKG